MTYADGPHYELSCGYNEENGDNNCNSFAEQTAAENICVRARVVEIVLHSL